MSKQLTPRRHIFKIHSARLRDAKWNLRLSLSDAKRSDEVIALSESQMLRWIDELNGVTDRAEREHELAREIRWVRKQEHSVENKRRLQELLAADDQLKFVPDYMTLVIDKKSDYLRAVKGFKINDVKYARLLGTTGGVKNSTIVFVNAELVDELRQRIDNGRDTSIPVVPAKQEAYRALTCSASTPVSDPRGIIIVKDCETVFHEDVIMLDDDGVDEPNMQVVKDYEVKMNASDGFGLMMPSLAERWSQEIGLDYTMCGCNSRYSWEKGMVFTFDFVEFAEKVAKSYMVKDAWGHERDVRDAELILTTSMVKLWASYTSMEHYLERCAKNHYTFGIPKVCPKELDVSRALNYQFIQSYELTDEEIDELIEPTAREIESIVMGDRYKAFLFLGGAPMDGDDIVMTPAVPWRTMALAAHEKMFDDPSIRRALYRQIEKRITDAKIGVLDVHGNYSMVSGDPYSLCQSMFGLPVTGLLKAGEIYNKYWLDDGAEKLACYRAPMSTHSNICKVTVADREDVRHWYRYIGCATILNSWDTMTAALNGCDFDGDMVFLTDNKILVSNIRPTLTVVCAQHSAVKKVAAEDDFVAANIASFGDDIGRTTNWVTSMYDVQARYPRGSKEYETLAYRIICGQLFQQNSIDKAKGIVCKPMPKTWYDYRANAVGEDASEEDRQRSEFYRSILADKKPYFMRYIYQDVMKQYKKYIKTTHNKCEILFSKTMEELLATPADELTEDEAQFLRYYHERMPLSTSDSVMNRICRRVEQRLEKTLKLKMLETDFDASILRSDAAYTRAHYYDVQKIYRRYCEYDRAYAVAAAKDVRENSDKWVEARQNLIGEFQAECAKVVSDSRVLANIVVDLCYSHEGSKSFAWDVCRDELLHNLIENSGGKMTYPVRDDDGDLVFKGRRYRVIIKEWENDRDDTGRTAVV